MYTMSLSSRITIFFCYFSNRSGLIRTPSSTCSSQGRRLVKNTAISPVQHTSTVHLNNLHHIPNPPLLPPVHRTSKSNLTKGFSPSPPTMASDIEPGCSSCTQQRRKLPSLQNMSDRVARLSQKSREKSDLHRANRSRRRILKPLSNSDSNSDKSDITFQHQEQSIDPFNVKNTGLESYSNLLNRVRPPSKENVTSKSPHNGISSTSIGRKKTTPELRLSSKFVILKFLFL